MSLNLKDYSPSSYWVDNAWTSFYMLLSSFWSESTFDSTLMTLPKDWFCFSLFSYKECLRFSISFLMSVILAIFYARYFFMSLDSLVKLFILVSKFSEFTVKVSIDPINSIVSDLIILMSSSFNWLIACYIDLASIRLSLGDWFKGSF